jgi:cell fate (sporulation/competence/biofilm development) regulator YlbF (YheA/YmcA/DUF963 family)
LSSRRGWFWRLRRGASCAVFRARAVPFGALEFSMSHHHHHHSLDNAAILAKTRELCETILSQPEIAQAFSQVEAFAQNEAAQAIYQDVMQRGEALHDKQHRGFPLADSEVDEFEQKRGALLANATAKNFLDARETMHGVHHAISDWVGKALELGRVPQAEDFESGCCGGGGGGGCGCSH